MKTKQREPREDGCLPLVVCFFALMLACLVWRSCCVEAPAYAGEPNQFIQGYDFGRAFLKPKTYKGAKYRRGLQKMHERYGPWCWKYQRYNYVPCLSRIWLESRGNPWSHTKDTYLLEAGLTSVSWSTASRLSAIGRGGDPCGDPEWSIAANGWRQREQRINMLHGVKDPESDAPSPKWWAEWLPQQCADNRIECEYFMSACGSVNCWKVKKAILIADKAVRSKGSNPHLPGGIIDHKHSWWKLMIWLRGKNDAQIHELFDPLPTGPWRFGTRWGRVVAGWNMRAEFFPPLDDGSPNYCWGDEMYWFPTVPVPSPTGEISEIDLFPEPLYKMPKHSQWRKRCVLYGTKPWKKIMGEPKRNDRWKTGGFKYHPLTGEPIKVKKGAKKYSSDAEFQAVWEKWKDKAQAQRLLPSDEEYATWEQAMTDEGCTFTPAIADEEWQKLSKKKKKKAMKDK